MHSGAVSATAAVMLHSPAVTPASTGLLAEYAGSSRRVLPVRMAQLHPASF
jgi:hypothetical protein